MTIVRFKTSDARIVITSSSLHAFCRELDLNLLTSSVPAKPTWYDGIWRYARSKLGNILFTRELSRRLLLSETVDGEDSASRRVLVNCFFPGNIATEQMDIWKKYLGAPLGWSFKKFFSIAGQTTKDGAATALFLVASDKVKEGDGIRGEYFIPIAKRSEPSALARDMNLGRELWVSCNTNSPLPFNPRSDNLRLSS
jgi:NAD(P)-dependent dehydrogenase (short-subunit alcohol dehydrogenase family)